MAAGCAAMLATATAGAQGLPTKGADGYGFIEAVKGRDGGKVMGYLGSNAAALINFRNDKGESSMHVVTARRDGDWLGFFLARGGDPDVPNAVGDTPLHLAARGGWDEGVQKLLSYRATVDRPNRLGETALIAAVQAHQLPVIKRLLEAGANPDRHDSASGRTARDYAKLDTRSGAEIVQLMNATKARVARPVAGPKL